MMREIFIESKRTQTRIVLAQDRVPVEYIVERMGSEQLKGNIYLGRVENVLPGMEAAFVDIGLKKNAFLYAGDVRPPGKQNGLPIDKLLRPGQEIIVQMIKEPVGSKGAQVTANLSLPGRYLVMMPGQAGVGVSRKIENDKLRACLSALAAPLARETDCGYIVRTAAQGVLKAQEMEEDAAYLHALWRHIGQKGRFLRAPRLLHGDEGPVERTVRDLFTDKIDALWVDRPEIRDQVCETISLLAPELSGRVRLYQDEMPIFDFFSVENKLDRALARRVWLKCGGYLVLDMTEALTSVDVNSGKFTGGSDMQKTILKVNLEAAEEIARQIRLRDMGGMILIDFIDMEKHEHRLMVQDTMREALKDDRSRCSVLGFTSLGLLEMTRRKLHKRLEDIEMAYCPYCLGAGRVLSPEHTAHKAAREAGAYLRAGSRITICACPEVVFCLEDMMHAGDLPGDGSLALQSEEAMHFEKYEIIQRW